MQLNGWLILDKPLGLSSAGGVAAVKRALRDGGYPRQKIGHGGTLDPLATGILPIALGEATKLAGRMLDADKVYDFTIAFGAETATLDAEGDVVEQSPVRPDAATIAAALARFTGPIAQVPPAYSALKVDGRRAYARARAGEAVTLAPRHVTVHALTAAADTPAGTLDSLTLTARVSKGTYVRSLARDIARALGTVGHVAMLRRTAAGPFALDRAISLDKLAELGHARAFAPALLPLTAGLDDIPALPVTIDQARRLRMGQRAVGHAGAAGLCLAMDGDVPVALVEADEDGLRVVRGFNL
jgi:tRNA pseudouridine55 synthase